MAQAHEHLANLQSLLAQYGNEESAYIPRYIPVKETDTSPYDHLSRWGEWALKEAAE